MDQLFRGEPAHVARVSAVVTREAHREPHSPVHRLQDLFHTRNERVHRRPARQRLARIHELKPREARQRGSRSGHDGIPDPQRVHGRTCIERHEAQLSQQDLSRDAPL